MRFHTVYIPLMKSTLCVYFVQIVVLVYEGVFIPQRDIV